MILNDLKLYHKFAPSQGKIAAIDVGTKRIGLASCDETWEFLSPKMIIECKNQQQDFTIIKNFIEENSIKAVVIGFPTHMDGKEVKMSDFVRKFCTDFNDFLENKMPIFMFDERLSSFEAEQIAKEIPNRKKQKHHDDIAAFVILRGFLNFLKYNA
jgi:putative Holliday junction resolvase